MKKKFLVAISLVMGLFIIVGFGGGQSAEASSVKATYLDSQSTVTSVTKVSRLSLKGEVTVKTDKESTTKYAKIYVQHNGTKYYDSCAKLISSKPEYDSKGLLTGKHLHVYKFCGCKAQ